MPRPLTADSRRLAAALLCAACVLLPAGAAQTGVEPGDIFVVTSDGLFHLRDGDVTWLEDSLTLGFTAFAPHVAWEPGSDAVLITSGHRLLRVTLGTLNPIDVTVEDVTPAVTTTTGAPPRFLSLDIHPGTGELFLLEAVDRRVLRYPPPFTPGMTHDLTLPDTGPARALAVDSRRHPNGVALATNSSITIHTLPGGIDAIAANGANGLDVGPDLKHGVFASSTLGNSIRLWPFDQGGSFFIDLNLGPGLSGCQPYVLGPGGVAWDPGSHYVLVLARGGVNPLCSATHATPNQVVRLALVPGDGNLITEPLTQPLSGITGTNGDLAVVAEPHGFVAPYGAPSTSPTSPVLDVMGNPPVAGAGLILTVDDGPPSAPFVLIVGLTPVAVPFVGATLWASLDAVLALPALDGQGAATVPLALPLDPVLNGLDLYLQSAHPVGADWSISQGLQLHVQE